jgi:hypothetical protein
MNAGETRFPDGTESECPVCRWPDQGLAACGRCGMEWRAWNMADSESPAGEPRIMAARRRYDLRVAIRAAGRPGERDRALLTTLGRLVRGGAPQENEIDHAVAEFDTDAPDEPTAMPLGFTLSRLVAAEIDAIEFVEISPDWISLETLVADDLGVPARSSSSDRLSWSGVLPVLPADEGLRRYRLAGGIVSEEAWIDADEARATTDPVALTTSAETAAGQAIRQLLEAATARIRRVRLGDRVADLPGSGWPGVLVDTVLVRRTTEWPLLEAAAAGARAVMRPVAEIIYLGAGTLADIVTQARSRAPLRYGYDLILAEIDPRTEVVKPARWQLFTPGTAIRPHNWPTGSIDVMAPPSAADQLVLPIVMRLGTDAADWPVVDMATMPGSTPGTTRFQVRLMAPGQVSFHGRPDVVSSDDRACRWKELRAALASRSLAASAADLVLLVELGGTADMVASRVTLATEVVDALRYRADLRIAVVGYRDHGNFHRADAATARDALIVGCGLERISDARSVLARGDLWQAVESWDDHAAPVEDALHRVAEPDWAWRARARHVLVVIGRRPPHPSSTHDRAHPMAQPCPHHLRWRDIADRLRREHRVECVVACHQATAGGTAEAGADDPWRDIDAEEFFSFPATSSADDLVNAIGLAADDDGSRVRLAVHAGGSPRNPGEQAAHE